MKRATSPLYTSRGWVWWLMPVISTQEATAGGFGIEASYRVRFYLNLRNENGAEWSVVAYVCKSQDQREADV